MGEARRGVVPPRVPTAEDSLMHGVFDNSFLPAVPLNCKFLVNDQCKTKLFQEVQIINVPKQDE